MHTENLHTKICLHRKIYTHKHRHIHAQRERHQFSHSVMSNTVTPWTAARQASLSITNSRSLLKVISIGSVMPSNHLILCSSPSPSAFSLSQNQGLFLMRDTQRDREVYIQKDTEKDRCTVIYRDAQRQTHMHRHTKRHIGTYTQRHTSDTHRHMHSRTHGHTHMQVDIHTHTLLSNNFHLISSGWKIYFSVGLYQCESCRTS